jgi:hypothetical protein
VCNGLLANIGYQQVRNGKRTEHGLITAGDDLCTVARFLKPGRTEYGAADVVAKLLTGCEEPQTASQSEEVCFA